MRLFNRKVDKITHSSIDELFRLIIPAAENGDRVNIVIAGMGEIECRIAPERVQRLDGMMGFLLDDDKGLFVKVELIGGIDFPVGNDRWQFAIINKKIVNAELPHNDERRN